MWSFGMVLAQSCGLTTVAVLLAALFQQRDQTLIQRLRDWYRNARHKSGAAQRCKRREVDVTTCFAPLLRWVIQLLPADCGTLALAMDASTLGQRFTILNLSVVIRGSAIPVAWKVVPATVKGAWRPHWEGLFAHLHGGTPANWTVIVLADRGWYARWLLRTITAMGWHPFLRINRQGQYRPAGATAYQPLSTVVSKGGSAWSGAVTCFKTRERQLDCTLLARWDATSTEPWLILTDLPPAAADAIWYGMRAWIEGGYKDAKRGGWHWEQTKMTDPQRAERLWLAIALATLWVVSVGCAAEVAQPAPQVAALPATHIARRRASGRQAPRTLSCFRRGRLVLVAALLHGNALPVMRLVPEPWPKSLDTAHAPSSASLPHSDAAAQKLYT
ncbi:MAG: transposase [Tepidimonas sp.]|uniref:transposase n=1 Tax=Tepidimonas sp. TaxID=2002775 RepID=UPI0040550EF5